MSRIAVALTACAALASACSPAATHPPRPQAAPPRLWALGTEDYPDVTTIPPTTEPTTTTTEAPVAEPVPVTTPAHTHTTTATTEYEAPTPQGRSNRGACGGSLPPCYVLARESGGDPGAVNPDSGAAGLWQMLRSTSQALGYDRPMNEYDVDTQNEAARRLYANGAGCSHWQAC